MVLCAVYQIVLSSGLNVYLMSPQRGPGLLSLNKEGIASTVGEYSTHSHLQSAQFQSVLSGLTQYNTFWEQI